MPELLVSYSIKKERAAPVGQRVWDNGLVESYQTWRPVMGADGEYDLEPTAPGWSRLASLSEAQLEAVRQAVEAANVADIPEDIPRVVRGRSTVSSAEWKVRAPDGLKEIRVAPWGPLDEAAGPLMELMLRVGMIVNLAAGGLEGVPD
jgi:hypothetical protein